MEMDQASMDVYNLSVNITEDDASINRNDHHRIPVQQGSDAEMTNDDDVETLCVLSPVGSPGERDEASVENEERLSQISEVQDQDQQPKSLNVIKHERAAKCKQMDLLISTVEKEFDNELIRVQEETKRAIDEIQKSGDLVLAHIRAEQQAFADAVILGMEEFKDLNDQTMKNIESLEFIQNQFSNTFRETGLL